MIIYKKRSLLHLTLLFVYFVAAIIVFIGNYTFYPHGISFSILIFAILLLIRFIFILNNKREIEIVENKIFIKWLFKTKSISITKDSKFEIQDFTDSQNQKFLYYLIVKFLFNFVLGLNTKYELVLIDSKLNSKKKLISNLSLIDSERVLDYLQKHITK